MTLTARTCRTSFICFAPEVRLTSAVIETTATTQTGAPLDSNSFGSHPAPIPTARQAFGRRRIRPTRDFGTSFPTRTTTATEFRKACRMRSAAIRPLTFFGRSISTTALDFVPKGQPGVVQIGGRRLPDLCVSKRTTAPGTGIDRTALQAPVDQIPAQHIDMTSPYVDENQVTVHVRRLPTSCANGWMAPTGRSRQPYGHRRD